MFIAQVYDKNTSKDMLLTRNGIASLNKASKCIIKEKLNGEYELELEYPLDDTKVKHLDKWNIIKADNQLFRIYKTNEDMINHTINVSARHIFYDLDDGFMIDNRAENKTVKQAMEIALRCDDLDKLFTVDSDIEDINTLYMVEQSPLTSMFEIINRWKKGELIRDNFNITIRNDVTYSSGIEIRYKKNMLSLNKETDIDRICTRIYPKGKNGITLTEKYISVPNIKVGAINSPPREKTKLVKFEEAEDVVTLRKLAEKYVEKLAFPFENIKVDFLDITTLEKYENIEGLKQVKVGDVVDVYHDLYNKHYKFKCIYIEKDLLNGANTKVELGEIREYFENLDFSEVYNAIEASKPVLYFYRNDDDLTVNSIDYTQLFYEGISVNSNTHLKLYIALNGVTETENILDIQILLNNNPIEFEPKHKLNIGNNVIGIPLAIPALQAGEAYYLSVKVKTDTGTFFMPKFNAQIFAEGVGLDGGMVTDKPHIEVIEEFMFNKLNTNYNMSEVLNISQCNSNDNKIILQDNIPSSDFENIANISDNILIELENVIDVINIKDSSEYNSKFIEFDNDYISLKTEYISDIKNKIELEEGFVYEVDMLNKLEFTNILEEVISE